jgi:hypothetical protein
MVISALNNYITEAEAIVKLQQAYEKRGMVKVPQLTQTILNVRERLVNQKLYLTSKAALENNYNAFYKKLTSKDPLQRGQAKAERKQKVERLNNGTYRDSNQPTYKEIFTRVGKTAEYTEYVKKYNILMAS